MINERASFEERNGAVFANNSLNLIRLLAALQVFYGHAIHHLELYVPELVTRAFALFRGVPVFFFLSGYLIWRSLDRTPNIKQYFVKRILRLYPELWAGVAVSLITIFIVYDNVIISDIGLFAVAQSTFMQFWTPDSLRGFGCGTPNGALWTVCVIVQFYIIAWFAKKIANKLGQKAFWVIALIGSIAAGIVSPVLDGILPHLLYKLYTQTVIPYLWIFVAGAFVCENYRKIIPVLARFWWAFTVAFYIVLAVGFDLDAGYPLLSSLMSCAACLGFAYAFPKLNIKYDISYGIYVYHMIVINVAIELGFAGSWLTFTVALILTVVMAVLSYLTVGMYSIRRKNKLIS